MSRMARYGVLTTMCLLFAWVSISAFAQAPSKGQSSYSPVVIKESFQAILDRMKAAMAGVMKKQMDLLGERYDLSNRAAQGVAMSRGKAVQEGVRAKLPVGVTWAQLGAMSPEEVRGKNLFPAGFFPLPHPNHPKGECFFPSSTLTRSRSRKGGT